ncbi:hypothetical protein SEVIR_3G079801v4 [Setaria viridis]
MHDRCGGCLQGDRPVWNPILEAGRGWQAASDAFCLAIIDLDAQMFQNADHNSLDVPPNPIHSSRMITTLIVVPRCKSVALPPEFVLYMLRSHELTSLIEFFLIMDKHPDSWRYPASISNRKYLCK